MSTYNLSSYLKEVVRSIDSCNGLELSKLLYCSDKHAENHRLAVAEPENSVMDVVMVPWDEIVSAHLRCLWALSSNDFEEACACQIILIKALAKIFSEVKEENWLLPVVLMSAVDLRRFASALDVSMTGKEETKSTYGGHMERVAQLIMKLFQICAADSRTAIEDSKKRGMMGLANQLFKIYFQINKLNLCKSIIRAIENMDMESHFSLAQRVTFSYYVGRKAMFDGFYKSADTSLSFAFERCLSSSRKNKRMTLIYLIPVRMLLGIFPQRFLLEKYNLTEFAGIAEATNAAILKTHLLPISAFTAALKSMGVEDIDSDETECILANLIYDGKIKGYLAHQQQKLVVSKMQAFPPL